MTDTTPYHVPKEPGRWRAITLAAIVHAALIALLWIGVRWQNETPVAVEAEVWSLQPREAAPRPQPEPKPEVKPEPKPEPKPAVKETPKPRVIEPPVAKPDIALEQEKKRKLREEKKRLEELQAKQEEKALEQRLAKEKDEAEAAKKKIAAEKARKAAEEAKVAAEAKKIAAEKKRKQDAADAQMMAKIRDEEMRRITSGVAGAGGTGDAPKAQGGRADSGYVSRLSAKIKSNTTYIVPPDLANNPAVEYTVELLPDGSVRSIKKLRPSGLPGFDEAVERAIRRSEPYPADKSGSVPSSFTFLHKPKDNQ